MRLNKRNLFFISLGLVLLMLTMLFPPWVVYTRGPGPATELPYGYGFLFTTKTPDNPTIAMRVNFIQLALEWLIVVVVISMAAFIDGKVKGKSGGGRPS